MKIRTWSLQQGQRASGFANKGIVFFWKSDLISHFGSHPHFKGSKINQELFQDLTVEPQCHFKDIFYISFLFRGDWNFKKVYVQNSAHLLSYPTPQWRFCPWVEDFSQDGFTRGRGSHFLTLEQGAHLFSLPSSCVIAVGLSALSYIFRPPSDGLVNQL